MAHIVALIHRLWWQALLACGLVLAVVLLLIAPGWAYGWGWTGFGASTIPKSATTDVQRARTLWDWLQLLVIPLAVAVVGYLLNRAQQTHQQAIAEASQQEEIVKGYLEKMSDLLLDNDKPLRTSTEEAEVRHVARAFTLTALRRLAAPRRRAVIEFLYEARLIGYCPELAASESDATHLPPRPAIISLRKADLSNVTLSGADLSGAALSGTTLTTATLRRAYLWRSDLSRADLRYANLHRAYLSAANLQRAKLYRADLSGATLDGADLSKADLREAIVTEAQLATAASLTGATLPDGRKGPPVAAIAPAKPDRPGSERLGGQNLAPLPGHGPEPEDDHGHGGQ